MSSTSGVGGTGNVAGAGAPGAMSTPNVLDVILSIGAGVRDNYEAKLVDVVNRINDNLEIQDAFNDAIGILGGALATADPNGVIHIKGDEGIRLQQDLDRISAAVPGFSTPLTLTLTQLSDDSFEFRTDKDSVEAARDGLKNSSSSFSSANEMDMMEMNKYLSLLSATMQMVKSSIDEAESAYSNAAKA